MLHTAPHPFSLKRMMAIAAIGVALVPTTLTLREKARTIEPHLAMNQILSGPADKTAKIYAGATFATYVLGGLAGLSFASGMLVLINRRASGLPLFKAASFEVEPIVPPAPSTPTL